MKIEIRYLNIFSFFFVALFVLLFPINVFAKLGIISISFLIYLLYEYKKFVEEQELEYNFPNFLRDLGQYLEIGQPLPQALRSIQSNNYGKLLNKYIKSMIIQMEYGYTFKESMSKMAEKIDNRSVREAIYSLLEAIEKGGDVSGLTKSLSQTLDELNNIRKERLAQIRYLSYVYYGLFILSLFVIYVTYNMTYELASIQKTSISVLNTYKSVSLAFLMVNAIFTGLMIGKIANGKLISGIYHSIILLFTVIIFSLIFF